MTPLRSLSLSLPLTLSACASPLIASLTAGDAEVRYRVSLAAPQTQMLEVEVELPAGGLDELELSLPVWRPGRYQVLDLAGDVVAVRASSGDGAELEIEKVAKSTWRVATGGADVVRVAYDLYANSIETRTRHVDPTHAFLSGSAVFLYSPRLRGAPVRVEIDAPDGWKVASGLEHAPGEERVLVAANYDVLVDSPIEVGEHDRIEFTALGKPHEIVIWPPGVARDDERMVEDFTKIIEAQAAVFDDRLPFERYVFLVHAGAGGGGTEHLNSTIMQTSRSAIEGSRDNSSSYQSFLGLVAHEYFHTWNVKQIRPAGIHPYDYQRENYTDLLWLAEGGTSYYGGLSLVRAGLRSPKKLLDGIGSSETRFRRQPGARVQSVADSSFDAWVKFSRRSSNSFNSTVDFYGKGSQIALLLDLELRRLTENRRSLDDVFLVLYQRFPLSGPGYTTEDLLAVLEEVGGVSFETFFERYVSGVEELPLEEALLTVGHELVFEPEKKKDEPEDEDGEDGAGEDPETTEPEPIPLEPYLGVSLTSGGSGARVRSVYSDGPATGAGILVGDELIALDGRRIRSGDLDRRLEGREPGDTVTFHLLRRDELLVVEVELAGIPAGSWKVERLDDAGELARGTYASWTGQEWPGPPIEVGEDGEKDGTPEASEDDA